MWIIWLRNGPPGRHLKLYVVDWDTATQTIIVAAEIEEAKPFATADHAWSYISRYKLKSAVVEAAPL